MDISDFKKDLEVFALFEYIITYSLRASKIKTKIGGVK